MSQVMISPALVPGDIYVHAVTGRTIKPGRLLLVRDVVQSFDPTINNHINAVWCRIAECVDGIPACERAQLEVRSSAVAP